ARYRVATRGAGVAEVMREKRLGDGRLGVVGLRSQAPTEIYGAIPANFWEGLTAAAPKARWEDISEEFSHLMLVKSEEELAQVRYAARAAEAACKVVVEVTAPGVGEEVVFAEAAPRHRLALSDGGDEFRPAHAVVGPAALDHERGSAAHPAARRSDAGRADAAVRQSGGAGADDCGARSARRDQPEMRAHRARF